jgi:glutamate carboxypeptidase
MQNIRDFLMQKEKEIIDLTRKLAEIESPSNDKQAVDGFAKFLGQELSLLGAETKIIKQNEVGNCLKAEWEGNQGRILLLCHMDTVWPIGEIAKRPIRQEGDKISGPGVLDMKASIAILMSAFKALKALRLKPKKNVVALLNSDEEIGSIASRKLIEEEASRSQAVLCLEPSILGGALKTQRKGVGVFHIKAKGKAAHAGSGHQKGISAIEEIARQIITIHKLTDYEKGVTLNVGVVKGGSRSNVIAEEAEAEIDLRFLNMQDGQKAADKILNLKPQLPGARIDINGGINRPPLTKTPQNQKLYGRIKDIGTSMGISIEEGLSGGGSDASFTSALGIATIDGLGADGDGCHALEEYAVISSLAQRAALLAALFFNL